MTIRFNAFKRTLSVVLILVVAVSLSLIRPLRTNGVVVPPAFAAALLSALPAIGTVIGKLFASKPPTKDQAAAIKTLTAETEAGKAELAKYAKREQIVWRVVAASGRATTSVATMQEIAGNKLQLKDEELASLSDQYSYVKSGVESVVASKPDLSVFGADAPMLTAIRNLITDGPTLVTNIGNALKYNPDKTKANPQLLVLLQKNLGLMEQIFKQLNDATVTELEMVADGIAAASAPKPPAPTDKPAVKSAVDSVAASAFTGDLQGLDAPIEKQLRVLDESIKPIPMS
jgi:hypothetical protein